MSQMPKKSLKTSSKNFGKFSGNRPEFVYPKGHIVFKKTKERKKEKKN